MDGCQITKTKTPPPLTQLAKAQPGVERPIQAPTQPAHSTSRKGGTVSFRTPTMNLALGATIPPALTSTSTSL